MNPHARTHLTQDPVLADLMARVGALQFNPRRLPSFESLTRSIVYQQLSGKAADTIFGRFAALYGGDSLPAPAEILKTSPERLREAGLSRAKASYILEIARKTIEGQVPTLEECDRMTDEALIERLTEIKGVGRWTVEMMLIFNLGRPDVLPIHDLGVRRGYQLAYRKRNLPEPEQLARFGKNWVPHRTTAALYLWRATDLVKGKIE